MTLLDAGLGYLNRGLSIVPWRRDKSGSIIKTWKGYQERHPSVDDVKGWFTKRFSHEFLAIVTGKISDLMVVDCDTQEAYERIQEFIPESLVTPIAKSPHGYHIYFKYKQGLSSKRYMPDVDIKTDGGVIIAPPSQNGDGLAYKWLVPFEKNVPSDIPDILFSVLLQIHANSLGSLIITSNSNDHANAEKMSTNVYNVNNCLQIFDKGRRNEDVFHVANSLTKGRCKKEYIDKVIEILGKNCTPPLDDKSIQTILHSANGRQVVRDRNLSAEVREWVLSTNGNFLSTSIYSDLQLSTRDERKNISIILKRMEADKIIEKIGNRNGEWRLLDQECKPLDWVNASCEYKDLWMPLGLGEICGVQPGNILVFAGAKDSGKTAMLMNIAKENRHKYAIHYFNSEMGASEFKLRASKFDDISIDQWKNVNVYERSENFADVIKPGEGNLNIIDFLEVVDEFWKVAATIQKIHQKLDGALCVVAIQKNPKADLGRGGAFSLEKARLYVSLDYQSAKIISCKNFKENDIIQGNPRGYTCKYKLVSGCRIIKQAPGWTSPAEKE